MAVIRSALPDVERPYCTVCGGTKVRRVDGPKCPHCQGSGWEPRRKGPLPPVEVMDDIYGRLANLGVELRTYRYEWTDEGAEKREQIRQLIRSVVGEGARQNLTAKQMAQAIGISRQALDNICEFDPSGRGR